MKPHNDVDNLFRMMFPALYPKELPKLYDADGEVKVGDIVRYAGKPCYIDRWDGKLVHVVTMDERKVFIRLLPKQLGLVIGGEK